MARAQHLIQELGCGEVTSTHFDCSAGAPREGKHFTARISGINAILGITVPTEAILDILSRLQFEGYPRRGWRHDAGGSSPLA